MNILKASLIKYMKTDVYLTSLPKMNLESVVGTVETLGYFGHVISTEEAMLLHNSLLILQNENHFRNTFFWGRILGVEKDYYIAFGYVSDVLKGRVYYYSRDCLNWGLLPSTLKK